MTLVVQRLAPAQLIVVDGAAGTVSCWTSACVDGAAGGDREPVTLVGALRDRDASIRSRP